MHNKLKAHLLFGFFIIVAGWIYSLGLKGGFLFDDFSNLGDLARYGDMGDWENAKQFILSGQSGPTGRPISLFSFWLTAEAWPNNPAIFKAINILIHLLCGILLYFVTCLTLKSYGYEQKKVIWISLLASSIWLLHPYFVSTTLYIVQRMTQLCLMFMLIGILGYFYSRQYIEIRPKFAYLGMTFSIGFFTILATYSKENGALLPLLILVIEYCHPSNHQRINKLWKFVFLVIPSIAILYLIGRELNFANHVWPNRDFNQKERLLSEFRIMSEYLYNLFIPKIEGRGLFQDGYLISKSLLNPISTLLSAIFLGCLFCVALLVRKKSPLVALAILFFFSAHLMESTILGLELYFEHRNYIASIFLFLPIALLLYNLSQLEKFYKLSIVFTVLILSSLSFLLIQRVNLWADNNKLQVYWAQNNPKSVRAQSLLASYYFKAGDYAKADQVLNQASLYNPNSGLLALHRMLYKTVLKTASKEDFVALKAVILKDKVDPQVVFWIRDITINISDDPQLMNLYANAMRSFLLWTKDSSPYRSLEKYDALVYFLSGTLCAAEKKLDQAYNYYMLSLNTGYDLQQGLTMAAYLGNHGGIDHALKLLDSIENRKLEGGVSLQSSAYGVEFLVLRKELLKEKYLRERRND
ncbi:lipopolysaccharide assembly protein LapB [Acinetobacter sp. YH12252]|uniref:tetratricopeptide repeat protein n=1 Tax=Acinetobacter sp. YH12252 TaxID=2601177 RepID=UPI0015D0D694|nr:hypothetical protein [Acinetobacter sp. YH12252]